MRGRGGSAGGDPARGVRARIPRYQRDMLRVSAGWQEMMVDEILTRELEGVASSYADDPSGAVPDFRLAMR